MKMSHLESEYKNNNKLNTPDMTNAIFIKSI